MRNRYVIVAAVVFALLLLLTQGGRAQQIPGTDLDSAATWRPAGVPDLIPTLDNKGNIVGYVSADELYSASTVTLEQRLGQVGTIACDPLRKALKVKDSNGNHVGYAIEGVGYVTKGKFTADMQKNKTDCS